MATIVLLAVSIFLFLQRHGSLLTFWRFTNRIIIIIIIQSFNAVR